MNIHIPGVKMHSAFSSLLAIFVFYSTLLLQTKAVPFPFYAHQFQLACSPKVTGSNSPQYFTFALPASYDASYTRYLILSGYNAEMKDKMFFKATLGSQTSTSQSVELRADSSINMVLLSIQILFITPNSWIWATNDVYTCSVINKYSKRMTPPTTELTYISAPTAINVNTDFKVYAYISWYHAQATEGFRGKGPPIPLVLSVKLQSSIPPRLELTFKRDSGSNQAVFDIGYVIVLVNQTELLYQNYPYYLNTLGSNDPFSSYPNLNINSMFVSSTFGGLNGNCLIGLGSIKISGNFNYFGLRGPTFTASYPISNVVNSVQGGDGYSASYNVICFTGIKCTTPLVFDPNIPQCIACPMTNCSTCLAYNVCETCATQNGLKGTACVYCPQLSAGCRTCTNSTFCMTCLENHRYVLQVLGNNSLCLPCADFITGCYTCTNATQCTACQAGFYININLCVSCFSNCHNCTNNTVCLQCQNRFYFNNSSVPACVACFSNCHNCTNNTVCLQCQSGFYYNSSVPACVACFSNCHNCTNNTVCIQCQVGYYYDNSSVPACLLCNTSLPKCNRCDNSIICLGCQASYFLANNICSSCSQLYRCRFCSSSVTCTQCEVGYFLSGANCQICSSAPTLANCLECSSSTTCSLCNVSYFLEANTCSSCSNLVNCEQCSNDFTCDKCATNYLFIDAVCEPCHFVLSNCLTCDNSTYCTSCLTDAYFISSALGICLPCSIYIPNCDLCLVTGSFGNPSNFSMTCYACFSPMVIHPNNTCLNCADLIPNCLTCKNYTYCQNCLNASFVYFGSNNTCAPCSNRFRNCSECTLELCTKCQDGFKLGPNSLTCNCLVGTYTNGVCNTIPGCVRPFIYPNKDVGCAACESVSFFVVPVYDRCQCRRGTLIGNLCTEITNCITALIGPDGNIICTYCNTTAGFKSVPENKVNCVCKDHYKSNGTYCLEICGDGFLTNDTKPNCDDGNNDSGDGCSSDCVIQKFYRCQNGSASSPSQCYYIGSQAKVSLSQIYKTQDSNQGVFQFKITPALSVLSKMDFSNFSSLKCNSSYVVSQISYNAGILMVKADYTQNMQGVSCTFKLNFDRNIVRSPAADTPPFKAVSETYPLIISNHLSQIKNFKLSFTTLSFVIMGVFGLSLTHKMIGAELLVCTQIVYLSNCFYQTPSIYLSPLQNLNLVTGNWSFYHKNATQRMFAPFSRRIKMSVYFLQNMLFVISTLAIIFALMLISFIYLKVKFQQPSANQQKSEQKLAICMKSSPIFKITKVIYRSFAFPTVAAFMLVILISGYINNRGFSQSSVGQFSPLLNGISEFFAWVAFSFVLGFQIFGSLVTGNEKISAFVGEQDAKNWYINFFIVKVFIVSVIIQLGITLTYNKLLFALGLAQLAYLLVTIIIRVYQNALDNIGVILCVLTECFSLLLPVICRFYTISEQMSLMIVYVIIGLLLFSALFAAIRSVVALKNSILECRNILMKKSSQLKKKRQITQKLMEKDQNIKNSRILVPKNQIDQTIQNNHGLIVESKKEPSFNKQFAISLDQKKQNTSIYGHIRDQIQVKKNIQDIQLRTKMKRLKQAFKHKVEKQRRKTLASKSKQ